MMMLAMTMVIMGHADDHDYGEVVMIITMKTNTTMVLQPWAGAAATDHAAERQQASAAAAEAAATRQYEDP